MIGARAHDLVVNRWGARFLGRRLPCSLGRGGITRNKREGDGATPAGVWAITGGVWRADRAPRPQTPLPLSPTGPHDLWSDDPGHDGYNKPHRGIRPNFGHERMRRGDCLYDLVLFSDWNTEPAEPGLGSAIFVHCWKGARRPTAGCIAFSQPDLIWIIGRWREDSRILVQP